MLILLLFSFLAGVATVLSPCVLPVLPALLSAGGGKGVFRPWGIVCGVIFSFTFFTLSLTALVHWTGISPDFLRYLAIALIAGFGLILIFPALSDKFAALFSGVADIGQAVQAQSKWFGSGFWSGFVLGIALGLVWTPCAGPILASITALVATRAVTWEAFWITLAYSIGAALPMLLIIYGGQKLVRVTPYGEWIRKGFGVLMIIAAFAIALHYDVKFQQFALQYIPLIDIENNTLVINELQKLGGKRSKFSGDTSSLPKLEAVPELVGITDWVNTGPITFDQLRGKVILVDFWTYSCINCIRTFPYLKEWYAKYKDKGLVIVGVHTPEFEFEKNPKNVQEAVKRFGILYPVAMDNNYKTWQNFENLYWPAHYLVDKTGIVRSFHFGEGAYMETENQIRTLLGLAPIAGEEKPVLHRPLTPETYLGYERGERYVNKLKLDEKADYSFDQLPNDMVGLKGEWLITNEKNTAEGAMSELDLNFIAEHVYLVMEADKPQLVEVLLDGKPLEKKYYTPDMNEKGQIIVKEPRKYDVVDLNYGRHKVQLKVPKGVSVYAFTFG